METNRTIRTALVLAWCSLLEIICIRVPHILAMTTIPKLPVTTIPRVVFISLTVFYCGATIQGGVYVKKYRFNETCGGSGRSLVRTGTMATMYVSSFLTCYFAASY